MLYRGQKEALAEFLPLNAENWITCGNALRLDWLSICPPTGTGVKHQADDLFHTPLDQAQIDFENEGGETYVCSNPPYLGYNKQTKPQKDDLRAVFEGLVQNWGNLDYVAAWFLKVAVFLKRVDGASALVATNSICQGGQVPVLWPLLTNFGVKIRFAFTSFKWSNLAAKNAGITVIVLGLGSDDGKPAQLIETSTDGSLLVRETENINGYLTPSPNIYIEKRAAPISDVSRMSFGNHPYYGAGLIFSTDDARHLISQYPTAARFIRPIYGSTEVIYGQPRACLWISDDLLKEAISIPWIENRIELVRRERAEKTTDKTAQNLVKTPHRFRDFFSASVNFIAVPQTTSENREYLPCALIDANAVVTFKTPFENGIAVLFRS